MPKVPIFTLAWSSTTKAYELYQTRDRGILSFIPGSPEWFAWLEQVSSFAFVGKSNHYTARKEAKQRGGQYWYAYLTTGEHLTKKYLGKTADLSLARLEHIANAFKDAGFPVAISSNIDAALKTHAVFITCIESAVAVAGGNHELASRRDLLLLMVSAIREGFKGLQARGIPIVPFNLRLMFLWMPQWFPVLYWQRTLQSKLGEYSLAAHANAAPGEIRQLIAEIRTLVLDTSVSTPAMDQLYCDME